ncbi:MAG: sulfatase-like hydrolase/transferase [Opitutales bacterium]|nr:sulfatase-like hydrolase/transferase [Opitutales bacterium]
MSAAADSSKSGGATGPYKQYLKEHGLLQAYVDDFMDRREKGWIVGASHDSVLPYEHHQDAFIGRKAAERIEHIEDDFPWYMFVNFQSPHDPFDPPTSLAEKYRHASMPPPVEPSLQNKPKRVERRHRNFANATKDDITIARRQYCAKIELIDDQIGLILSTLEATGKIDNTIVVFSSDHGEQLGDHGLFQKHTAYESSMRVPLVVAGPGIEPGRSDALVELFDLNPTLVELAGLDAQPNLDALSFAPILKGLQEQHRPYCVTCQHDYRGLRSRTHKYIESYGDHAELYDLTTDTDESYNLIDEQPELASELSQRLAERLDT